MYDIYQQRIAECDQQLEKHLAHFADTVPPQAKAGEAKKKKAKPNKNTHNSISPMNCSASRGRLLN